MLSALPPQYSAYISALGLGLLIGTVRERQTDRSGKSAAGMRTHTIAALSGAVAWQLGVPVFVLLLGAIALLGYGSYRHSAQTSPGLTGEITLLMTALLGGLAQSEPAVAAALAVLVALLLQSRETLHRFGREIISEGEVQDGLKLLAAGLLVLPLLPNQPVGPFGVINLAKLWQLVVLVMAISALGHVALRTVGSRFGLPLAGFFSGFVSSTAAIAGFGQRQREQPALRGACLSASFFAAVASLLLAFPVLATVSSDYLQAVLPQLAAFGLTLAGAGALGLHRALAVDGAAMPTAESRMFRMQHALYFAGLIAAVLLISAWLQSRFGSSGVMLTAAFAALVELHAAMASVAQLSTSMGQIQSEWALQAVLAASVVARTLVAVVAGGSRFGLLVGLGLFLAFALSTVVAWLT